MIIILMLYMHYGKRRGANFVEYVLREKHSWIYRKSYKKSSQLPITLLYWDRKEFFLQ